MGLRLKIPGKVPISSHRIRVHIGHLTWCVVDLDHLAEEVLSGFSTQNSLFLLRRKAVGAVHPWRGESLRNLLRILLGKSVSRSLISLLFKISFTTYMRKSKQDCVEGSFRGFKTWDRGERSPCLSAPGVVSSPPRLGKLSSLHCCAAESWD